MSVLDLASSGAYGIAICNFVPSLFGLAKWSVAASVKHKDRVLRLHVDETSGYLPLRNRSGGHVPDEVAGLIADFNARFATKTGWTAKPNGILLAIGQGTATDWLIPDLVLNRLGKPDTAVEMFHKWHAGQLERRLRALAVQRNAAASQQSLILGVPKALLKPGTAAAQLAADPALSQRIMVFNHAPTAAALAAMCGR